MVRGGSMKKKNIFIRILNAIGNFFVKIFLGIKNWFVSKGVAIKEFFQHLFDKEYRRKKKMNTVKIPKADKAFNGINAVVMILLIVLIVVPLLYLIASAFSDGAAQHKVVFLPMIVDEVTGNLRVGITFDHFKYILFEYQDGIFINSFKNTAAITVAVTLGSNVLMALAALPAGTTAADVSAANVPATNVSGSSSKEATEYEGVNRIYSCSNRRIDGYFRYNIYMYM